MRSFERKEKARRGSLVEHAGVGTGDRPRHVLKNVLRHFDQYVADPSKQEEMDDLLARRAHLNESIAKVGAEVTSLTKLLSAEPREELLRLEKYWSNMKEEEERRAKFLEERLASLEMKEALRKK